jgi:ATP-binding cassette, subfamily B, bacterial AbcA/BmrA
MSGAGKSTLMNLIERFYTPNEGSISYGGTDINDFALRSWRRAIGYVTQDAYLIDGTVRDNLLYSYDGAISDEELLSKLDSFAMKDLIDELNNGLDTDVGESGSALSGGQRQRVCIARMLLNPPRDCSA